MDGKREQGRDQLQGRDEEMEGGKEGGREGGGREGGGRVWDRMTQVVPLADLLLDPYYRIIEVGEGSREGGRRRGEKRDH